jgi:tripartite-type tricarboxylate transporter receptor subunit TctC
VQELIKYAKDKPGTLSFGSTGIGGANHLAGELFKFSTGIEACCTSRTRARPRR